MQCAYKVLMAVIMMTCIGCMSRTGEPERSGYNNDPFTKPGIITPLTLPDSWPTNIHRNPHNLSNDASTTKLVVLGTGMPLPNPYRSGPGYALVVNDYPYLIDAGEGIWRSISRAALVNGDEFTVGLSPEKLKYLFVTHLHEDHTIGIPSLLLNPFKLDIPTSKEIYGPKGTADMVRHIVAAWKIDIEEAIFDGYNPEGGRATGHDIEFADSGIVYEDRNAKVAAFRTKHGSLADTFAYRFTTSDRVVVFTGDGGPYHENIVRAAMDANVLVAETVTEDNIQYAPWGGDTVAAKKKEIFRFHFSPAVLARIANEANVKTIVLSHEQNYNSGDDYDALGLINEVIAAGFEGTIYSAMDADVY
ncbi:MAG: MBL fold metallo-hydrolase [Gammaproteobacteria bacterium]|nr:MBL fold metallo-hydrolase [Gammaproteobacteria bacterium]